ncbi:histone-lysine N-methyltransferase SETMAR [Maniola hyperantus]|uniref:histone-lysine N-methyltransferase SETMAR n=1 Tax=Aphantopus hyperantus TaxID=2795564 RepID=UPI001567E346|nr:histone-lysine N-methyltransferase SETMAR [Maniola hyperantus]
MTDSYSHGDIDVLYINENIPGPSEQTLEFEELIRNFHSQLMHSCKCKDECLPDSCECLQISGGLNYTLLVQQETNSEVFTINKNDHVSSSSYPIIECNELCQCSDSCGNRLVQNGPITTLYIKSSQNKLIGLGLFTNTLVPKGSFVCEYAGEVLTKKQALFRHHYNEKHKKMNYIFCLNEHVAGKTVQTYIDPSSFGNIGRYINHSCDPNCGIVPVRVNSPIPKLAVFSLLDIKPDTEITFHYGSDDMNNPVPDQKPRKPCLCNTSKCKGFMPYLPC